MFNWLGRPNSATSKRPGGDARVGTVTTQSQPRQLGLQLTTKHDGNGNVALSVSPPDAGAPPQLDVCVVVDVSGSMGESANPNGPEETKLFSKMDLAKRGAEVIARSLGPDDTLAILGFESRVTRWLEPTRMDGPGLTNALARLDQLRPGGGTALWDGLCAGLQQLERPMPGHAEGHNRLAVVILLTDGQPCPSPPEGEVAELQKYLAAHAGAAQCNKPLRTCKLVTMGFGYDVNSKLLLNLANIHGGDYGNDFAFVPDGTMLLTNFINMMANLKSTCMRKATLRITPPAVAAAGVALPETVVDVAGAMDAAFTTNAAATAVAAAAAAAGAPRAGPTDVPSLVRVADDVAWRPLPLPDGSVGLEVLLGDVLYGCPRNVVLRERNPDSAASWQSWDVEVCYEPLVPGCATSKTWPKQVPSLDVPFVTRYLHRALAVNAIQQAARTAQVDLASAQQAVKDCALKTMSLQGTPALQGLEPHPILEDLLGEVSQAVASTENWTRWGSHYIRSLVSAHKAETCNNFKDPGVLVYGSAYSRRCREELNTMCDSLPVPTPSIRPRSARGNGPAIGQPVAVSATAFAMSFNNQHGGCFAAGSRVLMADGSVKPVEQLSKGDKVQVPGQSSATVVCVVKHDGTQTVQLPGSGLRITAWHPVRMNGMWQFPMSLATAAVSSASSEEAASQLATSMIHTAPAVYNLVLDAGHVVMVEGVEAVTLGHGLQGPVVQHPFYGTRAVVDSLKQCSGWEEGLVDLGHATWRLDDSGLVSGLSCAAMTSGSAQMCAAIRCS